MVVVLVLLIASSGRPPAHAIREQCTAATPKRCSGQLFSQLGGLVPLGDTIGHEADLRRRNHGVGQVYSASATARSAEGTMTVTKSHDSRMAKKAQIKIPTGRTWKAKMNPTLEPCFPRSRKEMRANEGRKRACDWRVANDLKHVGAQSRCEERKWRTRFAVPGPGHVSCEWLSSWKNAYR